MRDRVQSSVFAAVGVGNTPADDMWHLNVKRHCVAELSLSSLKKHFLKYQYS